MTTPTIKFRGVRIDNGEKVFGWLAYDSKYNFCCIIQLPKNGVFTNTEVHPDSVAQYTCMNDKNGKEIYGSIYLDGKLTKGGDVVSFYYKGSIVKCWIVFNKSKGMFCLEWPDGYNNTYPLNSERYEVLGSLFLNPELLK